MEFMLAAQPGSHAVASLEEAYVGPNPVLLHEQLLRFIAK